MGATCFRSVHDYNKEGIMRAVLEFDLPDDRENFELASHAVDWFSVVHEMDEMLRSWIKYGHEFQSADEALEEMRQRLWDGLENRGLTLD